MKKIVFLICICCSISYSQVINFPDANFKARLLQSSPSNTIAQNNNSGLYIKIDSNNDGEIEQSEALEVNNLNIIGQNISNLEGLQYFTNLTSLGINNNHVTQINLSPLFNLIYLNCNTNQLTSLDFSNLPNLKWVDCDNNLVTSLDFSYNPLFEDLCCRNNPNLTSIKIRNSHQQLFGSQTMLNECWTGCPNLNYICADDFEIPALQSYLQGCGITQAITIDSACPLLGNDGFEVKEFGVSPNPSASVFTISFPTIQKNVTLSVYNLMRQCVFNSTLSQVEEYSLDMSLFSSGCYLLKITSGELTSTKKIIKE